MTALVRALTGPGLERGDLTQRQGQRAESSSNSVTPYGIRLCGPSIPFSHAVYTPTASRQGRRGGGDGTRPRVDRQAGGGDGKWGQQNTN